MKRTLGLRAEIIISSGLLVGAALLFMTFLLLRLTETRLLDQAISVHTEHTEALCRALKSLDEEQLVEALEHYAHQQQLISLKLVNRQLEPIATLAPKSSPTSANNELRLALWGQTPQIRLHFPHTLILGPHDNGSHYYVEIFTSIKQANNIYGLQLRYSLQSVFEQLLDLIKIALFFCVGYGLILVVTALFLLNPSVIRPVVLLTGRALQIRDGDLSQRAPESGPREIQELGAAFNSMIDSLQNSLEEQKHQYRKLQETYKELKLTQQHLAHSERIASIGNLTSGIAHELGNPLSATIGYLELLKHRCHEEKNRDLIERGLNETHRMDQLIKDLLDFTAPEQQAGDLSCTPADVLHHSCAMLQQQGALKQRVFNTNWPEELAPVPISATKLQQILVNLLLNARDATEDKGTISLSARQDNACVIITVEDDGHGMEAEQLNTIFDPFYTTKETGKGRGLGLYVSAQLVHDAHGTLRATSSLGSGSCFTLSLPITREDCP